MNTMNTGNAGKTKGTIIKVPDSNPGLLFANGQQKSFTLEGVWKSPVAPAVNMSVDVELDSSGAVISVAVADPQQANKERLSQMGHTAEEQGKQAAEFAKKEIGALASRMGPMVLGAAVLLWIVWFFLPGTTINTFAKVETYTFWEALGIDWSNIMAIGMRVVDHGFFSLLGIVAIAAPFAVPFLKDPRAKFLSALPLVYIVIAIVVQKMNIGKGAGPFGEEMSKAISIGWGTYVLVLVALFLAFPVIKSFKK
jgi:hypothetical protein